MLGYVKSPRADVNRSTKFQVYTSKGSKEERYKRSSGRKGINEKQAPCTRDGGRMRRRVVFGSS